MSRSQTQAKRDGADEDDRAEERVSASAVSVTIGGNEIEPMRELEHTAEPGAEKLEPLKHAFATGNGRLIDGVVAFGRAGEHPVPGKELEASWQHNAAEQLHGWKNHAHHEGKPIELTRADYLAALKAVETADKAGNYTPHKAALSPHAPKRV